MKRKHDDEILSYIRAKYSEIGINNQSICCRPSSPLSCCGVDNTLDDVSNLVGYSPEELSSAPEDANLGLGCGNPQAIADIKPGECVLDLGCGGGLDTFLAARKVGDKGLVIGVDMTLDMINRARVNAKKGNFNNVDFRLGEIEKLPVNSETMDVIISNCVINLSLKKQRVFNEAFRVLKSGGRLAISDVVAIENLPEEVKNDADAYAGCVSGAISIKDLEKMLAMAGFVKIVITITKNSNEIVGEWMPDYPVSKYIASAIIQAKKP